MITYELASPRVIGEKFQEGMIILNMDEGTYFDIGDRCVPLLAALDMGISISALQDGIEKLETGAGQHLLEAIERLLGFGLLREVPARLDTASDEVCAAIISGGATFFIECHSDLAALIAADPIHDVDPVSGKLLQ